MIIAFCLVRVGVGTSCFIFVIQSLVSADILERSKSNVRSREQVEGYPGRRLMMPRVFEKVLLEEQH